MVTFRKCQYLYFITGLQFLSYSDNAHPIRFNLNVKALGSFFRSPIHRLYSVTEIPASSFTKPLALCNVVSVQEFIRFRHSSFTTNLGATCCIHCFTDAASAAFTMFSKCLVFPGVRQTRVLLNNYVKVTQI